MNQEEYNKFLHPCPSIKYPKFTVNLILPDIPSVARVISREEIRDAIREIVDRETEKFDKNVKKIIK